MEKLTTKNNYMEKLTTIILSVLLSGATLFILPIVLPGSHYLITVIEIVISPVKHYLINYLCKRLTTRKTE